MKKFFTVLFAVMMLAVCSFSLTACGTRDLDDIVSSGKLVIATNAEFPPFESKEGEKYVGIDIEIAQYIADELGVELVVNNMDFDAVVTSVQKGQSDLALAALTISDDRLEQINFSSAYFGAAQYLVVKKSNTTFDACETKEDVDNILKTLSGNATAQTGTTGYYYIAGNEDFGFEGFSNLEAKSFDNAVNAAEEVKNDRAVAAVVDDEVAKRIVANDSMLKVIDIALSTEEYGIGVNKKSTALLEKINEILKELEESGELAKIFARHTSVA